MKNCPLLLVSVRDADEAEAVIAGGAGILDIKEPSRGSLGMADADVIHEVLDRLASHSWEGPVSVACGEAVDWLRSRRDEAAGSLPPGAVSPGNDFAARRIAYLKLGLSQLSGEPDWSAAWRRARERVGQAMQVSADVRWIAVAYLDAQAIAAPPIAEVVDAAVEADCAGVLFDTFLKQRPRPTFRCDAAFQEHVRQVQAAGLICAAAGQIGEDALPELVDVGVDVIAVRSAVCRAESRLNRIDRAAVRRMQAAMERTAARGLGRLNVS